MTPDQRAKALADACEKQLNDMLIIFLNGDDGLMDDGSTRTSRLQDGLAKLDGLQVGLVKLDGDEKTLADILGVPWSRKSK